MTKVLTLLNTALAKPKHFITDLKELAVSTGFPDIVLFLMIMMNVTRQISHEVLTLIPKTLPRKILRTFLAFPSVSTVEGFSSSETCPSH